MSVPDPVWSSTGTFISVPDPTWSLAGTTLSVPDPVWSSARTTLYVCPGPSVVIDGDNYICSAHCDVAFLLVREIDMVRAKHVPIKYCNASMVAG